jgi:hypothetical protein
MLNVMVAMIIVVMLHNIFQNISFAGMSLEHSGKPLIFFLLCAALHCATIRITDFTILATALRACSAGFTILTSC